MIVNGVALPDIPETWLTEYPYCWIRLYNGTYNLHVAKYPWYFADGKMCIPVASTNICYKPTDEGASWVQVSTYDDTGLWPIEDGVQWANHDIMNGSPTATDIYFPSSEPKDEPEEPEAEYAERYSILGSILVGTARQIMRLTDSTAKVKPEEFEAKLEGINIQLQELTVTATEEVQTITPPSGVYGFSKVIVEAVENSGTSGGGGTPGGGEGGEGGDDTGPTISNGDNFAFGDNYIEQTVYTGMATYPTRNGDKKLPAPVGDEYKIISQSSGTYYLYTAPVKFYTTGKFDSPDTIDNSAINYFTATQNDSEWTYKGTWSVAGEPIWTSHDLYDRNNTVLYVQKSDNYTLESTTAIVPTPVECEDSYEVSSESLNSIVGTVQKLTNTTEPMTLTEVVEALSEYAEANGFT